MNPQELQEFVNQLDIDGGGRIEIDEVRLTLIQAEEHTHRHTDGLNIKQMHGNGQIVSILIILTISMTFITFLCGQIVDFWYKYETEIFF